MTFGKCEEKIHGVFLLSSKETDMNSISFTIALGKLGKKGEWTEETKTNETLTELFQHVTPIYPDMDEVYEITFEDYIMHQPESFKIDVA